MKLDLFRQMVGNRNVAVLGVGISNVPLIRELVTYGARVTAFDKKTADKLGDIYGELSSAGVRFELGDGYLARLNGEYYDIIFKTPGIRYDLPELLAAKAAGSVVTSEMEVFFDLCPASIIAVTGSDGKTTTTTLIYEMLKAAGHTVHLGGNIGAPLLDRVEFIAPEDLCVLELSSFQLHTMLVSPQAAVVTNITPNHLDMHKDMEEYVDAKRNIFAHQAGSGKVVLNYDNDITRSFAGEARNAVFFSRLCDLEDGFCVSEDYIIFKEKGIIKEKILNINDIFIPGRHNVENFLAAIAAVWGRVTVSDIVSVAKGFRGVPHRIEFVREVDGVRYYNSSIDSSPNRTKNTLSVFDEKLILIAGGKDKGIEYDGIGEVIASSVKILILIGATAGKIRADVIKTGKEIEMYECGTYEEVVALAKEKAARGDVVLLSPASTSFDMFDNFEQRGNKFKELVNNL